MIKKVFLLSLLLSTGCMFAAQDNNDENPEQMGPIERAQMGPIERAHFDRVYAELRTAFENDQNLPFEEALEKIMPQFIAEELYVEQMHARNMENLDEQEREALRQQGVALLREIDRLNPEQRQARLDRLSYDQGFAMYGAREEYAALRQRAEENYAAFEHLHFWEKIRRIRKLSPEDREAYWALPIFHLPPQPDTGYFSTKTKAAIGIGLFAVGLYWFNQYRKSFREKTS